MRGPSLRFGKVAIEHRAEQGASWSTPTNGEKGARGGIGEAHRGPQHGTDPPRPAVVDALDLLLRGPRRRRGCHGRGQQALPPRGGRRRVWSGLVDSRNRDSRNDNKGDNAWKHYVCKPFSFRLPSMRQRTVCSKYKTRSESGDEATCFFVVVFIFSLRLKNLPPAPLRKKGIKSAANADDAALLRMTMIFSQPPSFLSLPGFDKIALPFFSPSPSRCPPQSRRH